MRSALLIVLLLIPAGLAQTQVLEDSPDDAAATTAGTATPGVDTSSFDLVGAWVQEEADSFAFSIQFVDIDPANPDLTDTGFIDLDFNHADQGYRLRLFRDATTGANRFGCNFMAYDGGRGDYINWDRLEPVIDGASETATMTVPRDWLLDGNGTAPTVGRAFDYFRAFARNNGGFTAPSGPSAVQIRDAMPDTGYGSVPFPIALGLTQSGHAHLSSDTPVRASNGEKGTFVYYVTAENLRDQEDRFDLSVRDVPKDWEITLPGGSIRLDANQDRAFPVLVTVPFAHQHGAFENLILEMTSQSAPSNVGRIELGIRYLEVPQPAGHHDTLFLHSRNDPQESSQYSLIAGQDGVTPFFNTLEKYDPDEGVPVAPDGGGLSFGRRAFNWELFLEPGLEMGLDFDLNRTGDIHAQFEADTTLITATFSGYLAHERLVGNQMVETVLASIPPTTPQDIGQGTAFDAVIRPTKASDLIPFSQTAALVLHLNLTIPDGQQLAGGESLDPMLTGGHFTLPLNEYRDSVEGVFNSLAGLEFANSGRAERPVNPGDTVLFNLTLTNDGAVDDVFALRVNGTNSAWARILGDLEIFVPTGSTRPVIIAVSPPKDAPHLDVADLIVTAASAAEPTIQGHIRVVALVDDVLDHRDESHLVSELDRELRTPKKSPGAPIVIVALGVIGIAAMMRRQRA